jgi:hypothetical protein
MSTPSTEDLIIPADRQQLRGIAGASGLMTALGAAFLYYGTTKGGVAEIAWLIVGSLAAGFFGLCTSFLLFRLVADRKPALVLSADGLTDNSSVFPAGFIAWSEVDDVRAELRWVALHLRGPDRALARKPGWRRKLMRWNVGIFGGHVFINNNAVAMQPEDLVRLINERRSLAGE